MERPTAAQADRALLMGVGHFRRHPAVTPDGEPQPGGSAWDDLPFVPELLARLEAAYRALSYDVLTVPDPDRAGVRDHWSQAADQGCRIVHVISHGDAGPADDRRPWSAATPERIAMVPTDGDTGPGTDVSHWVADAHQLPHPVLFVVDLCRAGRAARLPRLTAVPETELRAWVVAATGPDDPAYDGAFSTAVAEVLEQIAQDGLDTSPSLPYVRWDRMTSAVQDRLTRISPRQRVHATRIDPSQPLPELPFFPNPHWQGDLRLGRLATLTAPVRDFAGPATEHFTDRVGDHFVGRRAQLAALAPWIDDPAAGGLRIVTGAPGSGKSALLGALVCAGHEQIVAAAPDIRRYLAAQHPRGVPSPDPALAAVHARGRDLDAVLAALALQWRLTPPGGRAGDGARPDAEIPSGGGDAPARWTVPELITAVRALPAAPPLVLDALDEAEDPAALVEQFLLPLVETVRADGLPAVRLLVGSRRGPHLAPLLACSAASTGTVVDLDSVPAEVLRTDLEQHLTHVLAELPGYRAAAWRPVREALARSAAAALTEDAPSRRDWGPFLVARVYGRALESLDTPPDAPAAAALGAQVPRTLPDVLELDLGQRADGPRLRAVLAALAFAKGEGFPLEAVQAVAPEFAPAEGPALAPADVRPLLEAGRFYVRTGIETDGSALYRLFHQGLADHLRARPHTPGRTA
ncbi:ATP-binding protein [Streptomyces sp. WAC06614]|uniref:ATP-binding protein n=1 Tax=Streptomyces sp. WAC06614 TaxID=2487416 RepID=UPI000F7773BC|nr:ATP-binding protein [Streptomyces sp. WAC06614]RSS78846.1 ATP-binding protein [Streptomyces sp. WAC06614]